MLKPPNGWVPTSAPVHFRLKYKLPAKKSRLAFSRWARLREKPPPSSRNRCFGQLDRFVERLRLHERYVRSEYFFLRDSRLRIDVREYRRFDILSVRIARTSARNEPAFLFADFDKLLNFPVCLLVDNRFHVRPGFGGTNVEPTSSSAPSLSPIPRHKHPHVRSPASIVMFRAST